MLASRGQSLLAAALLFLVTGPALTHEAYGQMRAGPQAGQTQLATAMHDLALAQAKVDALKERAERSLAHDKNWTAAKAAVVQAEKTRAAVREQVKQQTMATPEYQALALVIDQKGSETQTADARLKMATMIWDSEQNSPEYSEAKTRAHDAKADLDARWKDYETQVLANDPDWKSANAALDSARAQVSNAMATHRTGGTRASSSGSYGRGSSSSSRGSRYGGRSMY
jgi:hypothetical protein